MDNKPEYPYGLKSKEDFKVDHRMTPKPVLPGELHDEPAQPIEERIPDGVKLRVVWDFEFDIAMEHYDQWNTPEKYAGNEVYVDGKPVPFEEYMEFWGNPDRRVVLSAGVDQLCQKCGEWTIRTSLGNIDFMDTDSVFTGSVAAEDLTGELSDYQLEVSRDLIEEALAQLRPDAPFDLDQRIALVCDEDKDEVLRCITMTLLGSCEHETVRSSIVGILADAGLYPKNEGD